MLGAASFRWAVLPRWSVAESDARQYGVLTSRIGAWAATVVAVVAPARLYLQARSLVDVTDPVLPMMSNVLRTTWGRGWLLQLVAALVALAGFLFALRRVRGGWGFAAPAALLLALSPAFMGHAVAADRLVLVSLGSDWLHVTAAGMWIGTLLLVTIVVTMHDDSPDDTSVASLIAAFHPVALTSATVLAASGLASLLFRVQRFGDLLHSPYGAILAAKLALTGCVAALGWHHARNGARVAVAGGRSGVARTLVAETVFAVLVIAVTALLVGTAPPMADIPSMKMN